MKSIRRSFAAATLILLSSLPAHALFEARVTYGMLGSSPDFEALAPGSADVPSVVPNYGAGVDVLVSIPLSGIGIGVRYENLGLTAAANGVDVKATANRTALLLSYRLIDTFLHIGPIASYGVSHSNEFKVTDAASGSSFKWEPGSTSSYSVGLEAGVGLAGFLIGAEAGYQSMQWKEMKDTSGTSTNKPDTDMSGTYTKLFLGFGI